MNSKNYYFIIKKGFYMEVIRHQIWENTPGTASYEPWIEHYVPQKAITNSALVIFPGSGYSSDPDLPKQEGERVAKYYCDMGINVYKFFEIC